MATDRWEIPQTDSLMESLREAFDQRACTGFTIWLTPSGRLQSNLRRQDGISWNCKDCDDIESVIEHIDEFNETERMRGTNKRRVITKALPKPAKKSADDLL